MYSEVNTIDPKAWKLVVTRNMSFWHNSLSMVGSEYHTKDYGVSVPWHWLYITVNSTETHVFTQPHNVTEYCAAVMAAVDTPEKVVELKKRYEMFADALYASLKKADDNLTPENWRQFLKDYTRFTAGLGITTFLGRIGAEKLTARLVTLGKTDSEISSIIALVTYPDTHTPLFDSQLELLAIAKEIQAGGKDEAWREAALVKWLDTYGIIPVNYCEDPWSVKDAEAQLISVLGKNAEDELKKALTSHNARIAEKKTLLENINDTEVSNLAYALSEGTYINEFRKNVFCRVSFMFRGMLGKIAAKLGSNNWRDCFILLLMKPRI